MYKIFILCLVGILSSHILFSQTETQGIDQNPENISLFEDEGDKIRLPFGRTTEKVLAGNVTVIGPEELMKYDQIQDVESALIGRIPGMLGGVNLHGLGNSLILVDGVARPLATLSLQEIESITVLRDVNASILYGVQANNGVILITTKRGRNQEQRTFAWVEHGVGKPVRLPVYLNAADYMELYNEALDNDGLPLLYPQERIDGTRSGINPVKYPDINYYDLFLRNSIPFSSAGTEFSGGNDNAQYYLNANWANSGTLLNEGEGQKEKTNQFNLRSNINFNVNHFIKSHLDIAALYNNQRFAVGDFWGNASTLLPQQFPLLIDTALVASAESALVNSAELVKGRYLLGGTSQYRTNVYGDLHLGGYQNLINTAAQFTNGIHFDLKSILRGLSFKTLASFDFYKAFVESQNNLYAVYETEFTDNEISKITKVGDDRSTGTQGVSGAGFYRRMGFNGVLNYSRLFAEKHDFSASAIAYVDRYQMTGIRQDEKQVHLASNVNYVFDKKYTVDFSSALVTSAKLPAGNRIGFSPSLALGYIMIRDNDHPTVNFLKFRTSAGSMNTDTNFGSYYMHASTFVTGASVTWLDGTRSNRAIELNNVGNPGLFYEKRDNLNFGLEAGLFNNSLWIDANFFVEKMKDLVVQRNNNYPDYLGGFVPYTNYGEELYKGIELGANWSKSINDFRISIGTNMTYLKTKVLKTEEPAWEFDYQYRTGKPVGAIFGLQAAGLFRNEADINSHASQSFVQVKPGDIKYVDQNGDNIIDQNDEIMIGKALPDFAGGLSINVSYKNFSLFGLATGVSGFDRSYTNSYYWVYGARKFSEVVLDRWTENTASSATYPRLTTLSNSNNFRSSSYWLHNNSRISINRIQLSYDFPSSVGSVLKTSQLGLYVRAYNLATIAKNSDRMTLNVGSEPQFRHFAVGIKALF